MQRIIIHWTGGVGRAGQTDLRHYHRLVEHDGTVRSGTEDIADNIVTSDGDYAAHTRNLNTGSIGVALCGMHGATEHPWDPGPSPLTEVQVDAACRLVADLCLDYGIPVTPETVLTHAEVQPTLGVVQAGKWDITRLPFRSDIVGAIPVGNYLRAKVRALLGDDAPASGRPLLRFGDKGADVRVLQSDLAGVGYPAGNIDGHFGRLTRQAVLGFQADQGLLTDGKVGDQTWAALAWAEVRPERDVTAQALRERGSTTVQMGDAGEVSAAAGTVVTTAAAARDALQDVRDVAAEAGDTLPVLTRIVTDNWPLIVALAAFGALWLLARAMKAERVRKARTGADLRL